MPDASEPVAQNPGSDTVPGGTSTGFTIGTGTSVRGYVNAAGNQDWYNITLAAGQTYTFALSGFGQGACGDTYLRLYNSSGVQVAFDDDSGPLLNSLLTFTATASGTYYVSAGAYSNGTGKYLLTANNGTTPYLPNVSFTDIADYIRYSYWEVNANIAHQWTASTISYNVTGLSAERAALARLALATWADLANLSFVETTGSANITFQQSDSGAYASGNWSWSGAISAMTINVAANWYGGSSAIDGYTFQTFIHEIGHALGLGHAGPYNGSATFGVDNTYGNDSWLATVMSYMSQSEAGTGSYAFLLTPMMADILAIQAMYGAAGTRPGDTAYGFNSTVTGPTAYLYNAANFTTNPVALTIFDSGGIDMLDYSGFSANQRIDLTQGSWSDVGGLTNNIGIALNTVIENAIGGSGNDTITGNSAANVLHGGAGTNILNGGAGTDTATYDHLSHTFGISWNGSSGSTAGGESSDQLSSVEILSFSDGYYFHGNASVVARMYDSALDRAADLGGLNHWVAAMDAGMSVTGLGLNFMGSQEFQQTYGALSNSDFVTLLYNNVLDRSPDAEGFDHWVGKLDAGTPREDILYGFSESLEHIAMMDGNRVTGSVWWLDTNAAAIARLYYASLDRAPDAAGLDYYIDAYYDGSTLTSIANGFINSLEFQQNYGSLDNTEYVSLLYNNALDRPPDDSGLNYWVGNLDSDAMTRNQVLLGFSNSGESIVATSPLMDDGILLA